MVPVVVAAAIFSDAAMPVLRGCGAARPLGSGLCPPGFQLLSLVAIAFLSVLASIICSGFLDTGSLDLETDFDGENFLDIFLGWGQSVKMRKDMCANCSLSTPSRHVRGGRSGTQAAAPCAAAATVGLMVFMLVSAGALVAAAAAVDACYVLEMGAESLRARGRNSCSCWCSRVVGGAVRCLSGCSTCCRSFVCRCLHNGVLFSVHRCRLRAFRWSAASV